MKVKIIFIGFIFTCFNLRAQQDMVFTNYNENIFVFNPAFTGTEYYTHFSLGNRLQHIGMKNAPVTNIFTCNSSIYESNSSVGGFLYHDQAGIFSHSGISISYAYKIELSSSTLSFGMNFTTENYRLDQDKAELIDPADPLLLQVSQNDIGFNGSFGAGWFNETAKVGFSITNLIPVHLEFADNFGFTTAQHYYFFLSNDFILSEYSSVSLSSLMSYTSEKPFQFETHAIYNIAGISGGIGYRHTDALIFFFGINIVDELYLKYAYDVTLNSLRGGSYGTSELMLSYHFYYKPIYKKSKPRYKWIRKTGGKPEKEDADIK
jgi:type IX secretion system PorP/SprF family membrane protein